MVSYLKNKARQMKVFTGEFNAACMITLVFTIGAYFMIPPFSWVVDLSETIKNNGAVKYGEPPYGHAELSPLKGFAKRTGLNLSEMMQRLENTGIRFDNENQTLRDIAVLNGITPQAVYAAMKPVESGVADKTMPDKPPAGTGKRSIKDISKEYGLDLKVVIKGLAEKRIQATADLNLRAIAEQNKTDPHEIYDLIRQIAEKK